MDFAKLRNITFFSLLVLITIYFLYIIRPFFYPIFWSAVIAGLFYPAYTRLRGWSKNDNLSAIITLSLVFVIIIVPLLLIGSLLVRETVQIYNTVDSNLNNISQALEGTVAWVQNNPITGEIQVDQGVLIERAGEVARFVTSFLFAQVTAFTQNSIVFLVMFIIMLYTLFYFLRDGDRFLKKMMYLSPLGTKNENLLYEKFISAARASIKGTMVVGIIQGFLGWMLFLITGINGALIWAIIMTVFAVIPALGSYVVWLPAGVVMLALGNIWQGIVIIVVGTLVIATIDNFLRPILVGKDTQMHPLLVLFSTLGGIVVFGISGFVIGPVVAALFLAFWDMYAHHYRKELKNN